MSVRIVARGFFGKIPARGDFVRSGLPSRFIAAWDEWASAAMSAAQARNEPVFRDAWLRTPTWRFVLAAGVCGPDAAIGVWLPGVDRAGRPFPLVLATLSADAAALLEAERDWLALAEQAGRATLAAGEGPDFLAARISVAPPVGAVAVPPAEAASVWWADGGPCVAPRVFAHHAMPPAGCFAGMLADAFAEQDPE